MAEAKPTVKKTTKTATAPKDAENEQLKKEIDSLKSDLSKMNDLEKQLAQMTAMLANMGGGKPEEKALTLEEDIPVISQCVGGLTLATEGLGQGSLYEFSEFGEIQDIPFGDLKDIVRNNKTFAQDGLFYIANEQAVEKLRLKSYYRRLLDSQDMIHLFDKDPNTIVELYKLAPDGQKEIIVDLVVDKKYKGLPIDANILTSLGQLCKKDLVNIEKLEQQ